MQPIPLFKDVSLRGLAIPLLTVVGEKDAIFDSSDTQRRIEVNVPNGKVVVLTDAGHGLVDTTAIVREFLQRSGESDR